MSPMTRKRTTGGVTAADGTARSAGYQATEPRRAGGRSRTKGGDNVGEECGDCCVDYESILIAIIGGVVGGVVCLVCCAIAICYVAKCACFAKNVAPVAAAPGAFRRARAALAASGSRRLRQCWININFKYSCSSLGKLWSVRAESGLASI